MNPEDDRFLSELENRYQENVGKQLSIYEECALARSELYELCSSQPSAEQERAFEKIITFPDFRGSWEFFLLHWGHREDIKLAAIRFQKADYAVRKLTASQTGEKIPNPYWLID